MPQLTVDADLARRRSQRPTTCVGPPVCTVPVRTAAGGLPAGAQLIAVPRRQDLRLRAAARLEALGMAAAVPPPSA